MYLSALLVGYAKNANPPYIYVTVFAMQKTFIILGAIILIVGLLWPWIQKLGLGRLPGDIAIERENFRFFFPFTTSIVISIVVTILIWLFTRR